MRANFKGYKKKVKIFFCDIKDEFFLSFAQFSFTSSGTGSQLLSSSLILQIRKKIYDHDP